MDRHSPHLSRRTALAASLAGAIAVIDTKTNEAAAINPTRAKRPKPPYRAWFAARLFQRDMTLYSNMTLETGGWLDPRLAALAGKTSLKWAYGPNHPDAGGPEYWSNACTAEFLQFPRNGGKNSLISAGIAMDEWVPPKRPENLQWLADGLRAGRKNNPEVFIAVWATEPTAPLVELVRDKTIDLVLVEGYTHSAASLGPGLVTTWDNALRRCTKLAEAGLENKTIFGFGHITAQANAHGQRLKGDWLKARMEELKKRFPQMPGVAFYQHEAEDSAEFRELLRVCDTLSAQFWPDPL